jgi:hypothetical protein
MDQISKKLCSFVSFRMPDDGQRPNNPLILSVTYHYESPLKSNCKAHAYECSSILMSGILAVRLNLATFRDWSP